MVKQELRSVKLFNNRQPNVVWLINTKDKD